MPGLVTAAAGTDEAVGPAPPGQIIPAGGFGGETRLEFGQRARIVLHGSAYYI